MYNNIIVQSVCHMQQNSEACFRITILLCKKPFLPPAKRNLETKLHVQ